MQIQLCSLFLSLSNAVLRVGFEQELYQFSEPANLVGPPQVLEQVCVVVLSGNIGIDLTFVPRWIEGSATGEC